MLGGVTSPMGGWYMETSHGKSRVFIGGVDWRFNIS